MKTPVQWELDLSDAHNARAVIQAAINSGQSMSKWKGDLRRACDALHDLCSAFESNGLAEEYEPQYLCLFDALSSFTLALRWPGVNVSRLVIARNDLDRLFTIGGEQ